MNVLCQTEDLLDAIEDLSHTPESVMVLMEDITTWMPWCHPTSPNNPLSTLIAMEHTYTHPTRAAVLARRALTLPGRVQAVALVQQGFLGVKGRSTPRPSLLALLAEPSGSQHCLLRQGGAPTQNIGIEDVEFHVGPGEQSEQDMNEMLSVEMECLMSLAQAMSLNGMNWDL